MKLNRHLIFGLLAALALLAAAACGPASSATESTLPASPAAATTEPGASDTAGPTLTATAALTVEVTQDPAASVTLAQTAGGSATATANTTLTPTPPSTPGACTETQGQFTGVDVPSTVLGYPITTRIYVPPCYASSGQTYPVLYLIHGLNYTEEQWQRLGIGAAADRLIASGEIAPLIIVLPRDRDDTRLDPAFVTDLLPYVDGHYRTLASAGYRAIGGMSRGGGWAIHLGLRYANLFGRVGAHSPAIFYGDEIHVLNYIRAVAKNGSGPALYLDIGDGDPQNQSAVWLDQMLTAYRLPHQYVMAPGGHDEAYWTAHLDDYLRFYAAAWRPTSMLSPTASPSATASPSPSRTPIPTRTPKPTRTPTTTPASLS